MDLELRLSDLKIGQRHVQILGGTSHSRVAMMTAVVASWTEFRTEVHHWVIGSLGAGETRLDCIHAERGADVAWLGLLFGESTVDPAWAIPMLRLDQEPRPKPRMSPKAPKGSPFASARRELSGSLHPHMPHMFPILLR